MTDNGGILFPTSDLHVSHPENREIVSALRPRTPEDWSLVAGGAGELVEGVERALGLLGERFATVVRAPGRHELWPHPSDRRRRSSPPAHPPDHPRRRRPLRGGPGGLSARTAPPGRRRPDRLLFSAKECVRKAWFPLTGLMLDFSEATVTLDPGGTFTARPPVPGPVVDGRRLPGFEVRRPAAHALVAAAVTVPRS